MRSHNVFKLSLLLGLSAACAWAGMSRAMFEYTNNPPFVTQLLLSGGVTINATDTGWYDQTGYHSDPNNNYIVGVCGSSDLCGGDDLWRNDFFVFGIPAGAAFSSAALLLENPPNANNPQPGYLSTNPMELVSFFDVFVDIGELMASQTGRLDIYNDLMSGVLFGSRVVSAADNGTLVLIQLNAAAVADINAHAGQRWAVGGTLSAIPEPSTLVLLGGGLLAVAALRRRLAR